MKLDKMREEGHKEGDRSTMTRNLKSIMQKMHLTMEEPMDMFDIPPAERSKYAELL